MINCSKCKFTSCNKIDIIQAEFYIITLNETWLYHNTDSDDLIILVFQEPLMRRDKGDNRYGV